MTTSVWRTLSWAADLDDSQSKPHKKESWNTVLIVEVASRGHSNNFQMLRQGFPEPPDGLGGRLASVPFSLPNLHFH
jgi:hypothetical protein